MVYDRIVRRGMLLASVVLLAGALVACGDDDGGGSASNQALIDAMVSEGASADEARCFVEELGDAAERLFSAEEEDLSDEDRDRLLAALEECAPGQ